MKKANAQRTIDTNNPSTSQYTAPIMISLACYTIQCNSHKQAHREVKQCITSIDHYLAFCALPPDSHFPLPKKTKSFTRDLPLWKPRPMYNTPPRCLNHDLHDVYTQSHKRAINLHSRREKSVRSAIIESKARRTREREREIR